MRRRLSHSAQVAFLLLASGSLLQAQRGGMSAHFSGTGHTGSSFSSPARAFAPPSRSFFTSPPTRSPSFQSNQLRHWPGSTNYRNGVGVGYRRAYPFVYAGYPWLFPLNYGFVGGFAGGNDPDDVGAYQPPPQPIEPPADYEQTAEYAPSPYRPAYQGPAIASEPARDQPTTTLIFKDGRPPAQVHNYALTGTTLFALDGDSRRDIPLSQLDVPATVEANHAAGVDFSLPVSH
jgi:hypothetical protein